MYPVSSVLLIVAEWHVVKCKRPLYGPVCVCVYKLLKKLNAKDKHGGKKTHLRFKMCGNKEWQIVYPKTVNE